MSDSSDLYERCRTHGIDPAVLDEGRDLEMVLAELETAIEARERHQIEIMQEMMQTLGMLSHKINNPLTSLLGRAQLLRVSRETDPKTRKAAEVIEESARRIADYVRELANVVSESRNRVNRRLREMESGTGD
jgi:signal transduction histidine kinase